MKRKWYFTFFLTLMLTVMAPQAQALQNLLWQYQGTSPREVLEDIVLLKNNVPATQLDHNDRLVALMTVRLAQSGPGSTLSRIRVYDAGTGAVLNQMDMPQPDFQAFRLEKVADINNDQIEEVVVQTRNANSTYDFVVDVKNMALLGWSLSHQNDLDISNDTGHPRPRIIFGDFDKDGTFNYATITEKGMGLFQIIEAYTVLP